MAIIRDDLRKDPTAGTTTVVGASSPSLTKPFSEFFESLDAHEPVSVPDEFERDLVFSPAHYTQGGIECIDAMVAAYGAEKVKIYCTLAAFKYQWRCFDKEHEARDRAKAIWYLRFAAGDDPRKDGESAKA